MTSKAVFAALRREVIAETRWALNSGTNYAFEKAKAMSSGGKSLSEIAANDHEYATRHPARNDDDVINRQSGRFKKAWQVHYSSGSNLTSAITNQNDVADYLEFGTRFMRRRPITEAIQKAGEEKILEKLKVSTRRLDAL